MTLLHEVYPSTEELASFGRDVCGVAKPHDVIARIGDAMTGTLAFARRDGRIKPTVLRTMSQQWEPGLAQAREAGQAGTTRARSARR